jgi:hypothetical protein
MPKKFTPVLIAFLLLLSVACALGGSQLSDMEKTLTPLSAAVAGTVTAQAADVGGAADKLATSYAQATVTSAKIYAKATELSSYSDAAQSATATVSAPVLAELPRYGLRPEQGMVAWVHKPVTIELNGYKQTGFANDYQGVTAKDFAMAADINWNTEYGLSACGFMFRSNGNTAKPSQYMIIITRFSTGYLAFTATVNGEMSNMRTIYPKSQDPTFNWQNDSTNRLAVIARGQMLQIYTNGILIGEIDASQPPPDNMQTPPKLEIPQNAQPDQVKEYQDLIAQDNANVDIISSQMGDAKKNFAKNKPIFDEGFLGFIAVSESGHVKCTFSDAWLFKFK